MDNSTPTGGGSRAPRWSNLCGTCDGLSARRYTLAPASTRVAQGERGGLEVESGSMAPSPPARDDALAGSAHGEKGLKSDAISYASNIVIGVASTAPGYSLAASLGFVVAAVGLASPAVMWVSFIPMLLVATSYYYLNRADPDCGTTFSWGTKAFGPWVGWIAGWGIIVADVIVMANLAQIAGQYTYLLFGWDAAASNTYAVLGIGVAWIVVMTWICYVGIEVSAKTQWFLLAAELVTLVLFSVVALVRVYGASRPSTASRRASPG